MAGEYIIQWTDHNSGLNPYKPQFVVNPREVNGPGRSQANTPLQLPGRYLVNYGELLVENLVHLLENFASGTEPSPTTGGMLWFDTSDGPDGTLKVRDKTNTKWLKAGSGGGSGAFTPPPVVGGVGSSTADFTAASGNLYMINTTTRTVTVQLPSTPVVGDVVEFVDEAGTWNTFSLVISHNGNKLMGLFESMNVNVQFGAVRLVYSGSLHGWRIA